MAASSLTGIWQGFFTDPLAKNPRNEFTATLIHSGNMFGGSTHEVCETGEHAGTTLYALLDGTVAGQSASFAKTYDGSCGWNHKVVYEGVLSADGTEIRGRWQIPGATAGHFIMTRPAARTLARQRRVLAEV